MTTKSLIARINRKASKLPDPWIVKQQRARGLSGPPRFFRCFPNGQEAYLMNLDELVSLAQENGCLADGETVVGSKAEEAEEAEEAEKAVVPQPETETLTAMNKRLGEYRSKAIVNLFKAQVTMAAAMAEDRKRDKPD